MKVRLPEVAADADRAGRAGLPASLKSDRTRVRIGMLQRLAASRLFAIGDRAGVLRSAQARSGRAFRFDVRQRVIVKALVSKHAGRGALRGGALAKHVAYLARAGAGAEGGRPAFFERSTDEFDAATTTAAWRADRHHFRFIISPENADRIRDLKAYTREVLRRVAEDLSEPEMAWVATCHYDTGHPHSHVLIRGRRASGRDLVIPRDYVGFGFRARAQEVAQELLGDLSRPDAERRIWRETQADRFTAFDRRLLQTADPERCIDDPAGVNNPWDALARGRLRRLEALGLANRFGHRYRLAEGMEQQLRQLQIRKDIIRTLHQRRLESGREVRELGGRVRGRVVAHGVHDELGGVNWISVQDQQGVEHYARLAVGQAKPVLGRAIELVETSRGAQIQALARSSGLGR